MHNKFFEMESKENLFSKKLEDGTFFWDIIRRDIFILLATSNEQKKCSKLEELFNYIKNILKKIFNRILLNYIINKKPKYIFFTYQRFKVDNVIKDKISDHLVSILDNDSLCIESGSKKNINVWKILFNLKTRIPPMFHLYEKTNNEFKVISNFIEKIIYKYFNKRFNTEQIIINCLSQFKQKTFFFNKLYSKHKPLLVIGGNDGSLKGLYNSSSQNSINSVELQHGASERSIMWTYPPKLKDINSNSYLPDYFFYFSKLWKSIYNYPTKKSFVLGNDFFYKEINKGFIDEILIISNQKFSVDLKNITKKIANNFSNKIIYFKIHPQQFNSKKNIVNFFKKNSNVVVVSDNYDIDKLLNRCRFVVGIRSTLLYESLQMGKDVFLLKKHNYDWDTLVLKYSNVFKDYDELILQIKKPKKIIKNLIFFDRYDENKFLTYINSLR